MSFSITNSTDSKLSLPSPSRVEEKKMQGPAPSLSAGLRIFSQNRNPFLENLGEYADLQNAPKLRLSPHGEGVDLLAIESGVLRKFSLQELEKCKVEIRKGILFFQDQPLTTGKNPLLYLFLRDGTLLVSPPEIGKVFHSSLANEEGADPIAAGELKAVDGKLIKIDERSGHYTPFKQLFYLLYQLKREGCELGNVQVELGFPPVVNQTGSFSDPKERMVKLQEILRKKAEGKTPF